MGVYGKQKTQFVIPPPPVKFLVTAVPMALYARLGSLNHHRGSVLSILGQEMWFPLPTPSPSCCGNDSMLKIHRNNGVMKSIGNQPLPSMIFESERGVPGVWGLPVILSTCLSTVFDSSMYNG